MLVVGLAVLPLLAGRALVQDLIFIFYMLALAQYWNLLAGYAGLVSVGQQAFVGLGGYVLFALIILGGVDPLLAIALAGLRRGALRVPDRLRRVPPARRLFRDRHLGGGRGLPPGARAVEAAGRRHRHVAAALRHQRFVAVTQSPLFGVRTAVARDIIIYWPALVLAAATSSLVYLVLRSRHGLALAAIRDSEVAAAERRRRHLRTKFCGLCLPAFGAGLAGALIYLQKARISPDAAFAVLDWTAYVIFIVVIGGIGTIEGPIVGVIIFYLMQTISPTSAPGT